MVYSKTVEDEMVSEDDEEHSQEESLFVSPLVKKKSVKFSEFEKLKARRLLSTTSTAGAASFVPTEFNIPTNIVEQRLEQARGLRKVVALQQPVLLDGISSSAAIIKAMDRIFRAYVKGNALPGQLAGGQKVGLAGHVLSFRTFVLKGPYLSWKGFVNFLMDFNVTSFPSKETKSGKKFWSVVNSRSSMNGLQSLGPASEATPPITLRQAAMTFIESSCSSYPVLLIRKFMSTYEQQTSEEIEEDGWKAVNEWIEHESEHEWEIGYGTNFVQFVDCLGVSYYIAHEYSLIKLITIITIFFQKLGLIAYSSERFNQVLPSPTEKIEHFLSAFLGLSDTKKWLNLVEKKLKLSKQIIKELADEKNSPLLALRKASKRALLSNK